jgi:hypothetical protein
MRCGDSFAAVKVVLIADARYENPRHAIEEEVDIYRVDVYALSEGKRRICDAQRVHRELLVMEPALKQTRNYGLHWNLTPGHIERMERVQALALASAADRCDFGGEAREVIAEYASRLRSEAYDRPIRCLTGGDCSAYAPLLAEIDRRSLFSYY